MFTSRYQNQLDDMKRVCSEKRAFKSNEKSSLMLDKALEITKGTVAATNQNVNSAKKIEVSCFEDFAGQSN